MINVGFIGAGNMGSAIMKGIAKSEIGRNVALFVYDCDAAKTEALSSIGVTACESAAEVFERCSYVVPAVKPQQLDDVLKQVSGCVRSDTVIVSICAGISDEYLASRTIAGAKVVLVMPNTPLLIGEGATALSRSETVTDEEFEFVCKIFASCGEVAVIDKSKMKEIIAINGSSPAFIYYFTKAFIDYAEAVGIDREAATKLFAKTLTGSAKMITDSGHSIEELIKMVSSKGGTTIAGLEKLGDGRLTEAVADCCKACTNRAYELAEIAQGSRKE